MESTIASRVRILRNTPIDKPEHSANSALCLLMEMRSVVMDRSIKNIAAVWFMSEADVKITFGERLKSNAERMAVLQSNISLHRRNTRTTEAAANSGFTIQGFPNHKPAVSKNENPGGYWQYHLGETIILSSA